MERIRIETSNVLIDPVSGRRSNEQLQNHVDPEHREFLNLSGGMDLYRLECSFDSTSMTMGMHFFGSDEVLDHHQLISRTPAGERLSATHKIWPIAQSLNGADYYASVRGLNDPASVPGPVYFLDHARLAESLDEPIGRLVSASLLAFLDQLSERPIPILQIDWRYFQNPLEQWIPVELG
jgi:hypothetical protein